MSQAFNNLIKLPVTSEFTQYWQDTAIASYLKDGYLNLRVSRGDYSLVTEGQGVKTKVGYKSVYGNVQPKRIGFRVRVRSQLEDLYLALVELANYTAGNGCKLNPIEILDYCHLHDRSDRDRGYRIRTGVFEGEISQVMGVSTQGYINCNGQEIISGNRYGEGFSFKFMETVFDGYF